MAAIAAAHAHAPRIRYPYRLGEDRSLAGSMLRIPSKKPQPAGAGIRAGLGARVEAHGRKRDGAVLPVIGPAARILKGSQQREGALGAPVRQDGSRTCPAGACGAALKRWPIVADRAPVGVSPSERTSREHA